MLVVSFNPGYQNVLKSLKPSTRQRFIALNFNYPAPEVELRIVAHEAGVDTLTAQKLVGLAQALRRLTEQDLEETVSTRLLGHGWALGGQRHCPAPPLCQAAVIDALTDDAETAAALAEVAAAVLGEASAP